MSIFRRTDRTDSRWWIRYRTADGRWRKEPVGESRKLAKEVLAKREAEVAEGIHFPSRAANSKRFSELLERFWQDHGRFYRSKSWACYRDELKAAFGGRSVGSISRGDIQRFYNQIRDRTSASSANRRLTLLKCIFNKAKLWGLYHGESPCWGVKKLSEPPHKLRFLSSDEVKALLAGANSRLYPLLVCALLTGMRRGELVALDWENVDLRQGILYVVGQTKSGKGREIPILPRLRDVLIRLGPQLKGSVFNLPIISLRRYFDHAARKAGLPGVGLHTLRHTFASHFIMRTSDLPALQRLLGHSTPAMTLRYAHLSRGHMESNMAAFEGAIPIEESGDAAASTVILPALSPDSRAA